MPDTKTIVENILPELIRAKQLNGNESYLSIAYKHKKEAKREKPVSRSWIIQVAKGESESPDGLREFLENYIHQTKEKYGEAFEL